jgi:hypothetical protein
MVQVHHTHDLLTDSARQRPVLYVETDDRDILRKSRLESQSARIDPIAATSLKALRVASDALGPAKIAGTWDVCPHSFVLSGPRRCSDRSLSACHAPAASAVSSRDASSFGYPRGVPR